MTEEIAISIKNVNKTFAIRDGRPETIRDYVLKAISAQNKTRHLKALQNISFEVKKGETFGIIGRNGSGKSTLIHIIMGSMLPDKGGIVRTQGNIMRLSLGMGMDPKLSARDNIYVNGSVLGLSFVRIGELFDDIIQYADLEEFVDTPIQKYSKGMMARLKFSIAMHAEADIFLLDEFFGGVGDENFKKKSAKAFKKRFVEGKTNVLVSHSMQIISKYCDRVLWIDKGIPKKIGQPKEMIDEYRSTFKNDPKKRQLKND